jgi:Transglycosylase SLT domain
VRRWSVGLVVGLAMCAPGWACGGSASPATNPARSQPRAGSPVTLAARLASTDAALRRSLAAWRATDPGLLRRPSATTLALAARERSIVYQLSQRAGLAARTLVRLRAPLRLAIRGDLAAARGLRRLTGPATVRPKLVPPAPAGALLADYRLAQRRFGVPWQILAAVNFVESAFGRVVNRSSAGAHGPMQFLTSTWRAYGLGGDISSPHDAILGAANYLHQSGAPADDARALYAYNPSRLYVAAVLAYARRMRRDPLGFLTYYAWEASLP